MNTLVKLVMAAVLQFTAGEIPEETASISAIEIISCEDLYIESTPYYIITGDELFVLEN